MAKVIANELERFRQDIRDIDRKIHSMEETGRSMFEEVQALTGMWEGSAHDTYLTQFQADSENIKLAIQNLKEYKDINSVMSMAQLLIHFGYTFVLIMFTAEDLGSAVVFAAIFIVMMIVAGVKLYWFLIGGAAVALAIPFLWNNFLDTYQRERILAPYNPNIDPTGWGITWQTTRSQIAMKSGQFTGVGLGHGVQTQNNWLTGKHTDFIFAMAGEELGMLACLIIMLLLTVVIIHCVMVGLRSNNTMSMLVCMGVAASVFFQMLVNTGMCIGITPVIGITLPFFSYGGSSLMSTFAAVGLVSGVKYRPTPQQFHRY